MDFNVQDPTDRGPFFDHLAAFVTAEKQYISKRQSFFDAIHFTFPSFLANVVSDPGTSPVTHITDALPDAVANAVPDAISSAVPESITSGIPALWSRFRGRHG
jgi:hypothetical protein